jgi:uncharacterized protein (DUF1810 family)
MCHLDRYISAQESTYSDAFFEMKNGKKTSHWMWFIFPQISGLGYSSTAKFYELNNVEEAKQFLNDPVLGKRLVEITTVLVNADYNKTAKEIFGHPDWLKFHSCLTLFDFISDHRQSVFHLALLKFFEGTMDAATLKILGKEA